MAEKYASSQRNPKIDVSWIEGKISRVLYCLIGDSFRRALAEEWKKRYIYISVLEKICSSILVSLLFFSFQTEVGYTAHNKSLNVILNP